MVYIYSDELIDFIKGLNKDNIKAYIKEGIKLHKANALLKGHNRKPSNSVKSIFEFIKNWIVKVYPNKTFDFSKIHMIKKDLLNLTKPLKSIGLQKTQFLTDSRKNLGRGLTNLLINYINLGAIISKHLQFICDLYFSKNPNLQNFLDILPNDDYAKSYYYQLGPDRCKACGYNLSLLKKDYSTKFFNDMSKIQEEVYNTFCIGDKKTKESIKELLGQIYKKYNYNKTAKAVDIEEYFEVTKTEIKDSTGKRITLLKLNKRKL